MPMKYMVTLTSVGTSFVIVVPKAVVDGFNLTKGQKLQVIVTDDGLYIPLNELGGVREPSVKEDRVKP